MSSSDGAQPGAVVVDALRATRPPGEPYLELVRRDSLSVGLYVLPAGASDPQRPHTEDEVYFVIEGVATLRVANERNHVSAGSVAFVQAGVEHRFEEIESDLRVLVFFAPAEGTAER